MSMKTEISSAEIQALVERQLTNLFMFDAASEQEYLSPGISLALKSVEHCFENVANKYYRRDGEVYFNPFHSGQNSIFLYFLSAHVFELQKGQHSTLCDRIYYLNKCLNGVDLFYQVQMPSVFYLDHPVGSVMGRANYGEGFSFTQNCTVGNNHGIYPSFGVNVSMLSGSKVIGDCVIGDNVTVAANTFIKDAVIPPNSLVFGASPNLVIKPKKR